jgi:hypothetical protein
MLEVNRKRRYNEARISKQTANIFPASLRSEASPLGKRQEEVLPIAKLEQRRYNEKEVFAFRRNIYDLSPRWAY